MIEVRRLTRRFGTQEALSDVSFAVAPGEALGLAGRVDSGGATLLKILATLVAPTSGSAEINGYDVMKDVEAVRRITFYVDRAPAGPPLRIEEYLEFVARARRVPSWRRAVADALSRSGLRPTASVDASAGVAAAVRLAAALMVAPPVLLLDGPLEALDPAARSRMMDWLRQARHAGTTLIVAAESPAHLEFLCSRIATFEDGRIAGITTIEPRDAEEPEVNSVGAHT